MKKLLFLITAIVLCVAIFAACGQEAPATEAAGEDAAVAASETFDAGNITVEVPEGWMGRPFTRWRGDMAALGKGEILTPAE